jgi:hypothetical protein
VRTLLAVVAGALLLPGAAAAQAPGVLTLKAPGKTTFGHRIELVGRLSPAQPGLRVRILRGSEFVTAGQIRGDGTFRIPLRIGSPGPFRAAVGGIVSNPVTVKIVPRLDTSLVGSPVVGAKLTFVARVEPQQAGPLRVRVVRPGRQVDLTFYRNEATVKLGTNELVPLKVHVLTLPRPGFVSVERSVDIALVPPKLAVGSRGPAVTLLARRLAELNYVVPSPNAAEFDYDLIQSVYAFQKVQGLDRTGEVDARFWARLRSPLVPQPRYRTPADHIEIDKTRQVLFVVRDGQISLIVPVSTAGIAGYYTPVGHFAIYRKVVGYDPSPLGVLLNPMYFHGGYAIHGNPSVPPYPASHGCIRVPNFVIYRLFESEPYGESVYIY